MTMGTFSTLFVIGFLCGASQVSPAVESSMDNPRDFKSEFRSLIERVATLENEIALQREESLLVRQRRESSSNHSSGPSTCYTDQCICPPGAPGPMGMPGQQGIPGRDGRDGRDWNGCDAEPTPEPERYSNVTGGSVFVRWGRSECGSSSELLYSGTAAGSYYTHSGSGSNYLCMPDDPIYDNPQAGEQGGAYVYGAEYRTNSYDLWYELHNSNVPCAVCRAPSRSSLLVIPARNVCPSSEWTTEYSGYMVSSHYSHKRTEYVCMDRAAEAIPRTTHNADGALFSVVESRCGSGGSGLPCGPYVNYYEVTCAVCTR